MKLDWKFLQKEKKKCSLLSMIVSCYSNSSWENQASGIFSDIIFVYTDQIIHLANRSNIT